jgi:hypothetical protein
VPGVLIVLGDGGLVGTRPLVATVSPGLLVGGACPPVRGVVTVRNAGVVGGPLVPVPPLDDGPAVVGTLLVDGPAVVGALLLDGASPFVVDLVARTEGTVVELLVVVERRLVVLVIVAVVDGRWPAGAGRASRRPWRPCPASRPPLFLAPLRTVVGTACRRVAPLPGMIGMGTAAGAVVVVRKGAAPALAGGGLVVREVLRAPVRGW